jgi:hypothetical protein
MVFSINPTANKTQEMFKQMAIAQNGTGTTAGIVATSTAVAVNSVTNTATATSVYSAISTNAGIAYGSGVTGSGEACSCSCFCGVAQFPSSVQGLDSFGGMPG